jgi:tRNA dimethylallyltransferase
VQAEKESQATKKSIFTPIWVGLELPKEDLQKNIETRVDQMLSAGLVEECARVMPYRHHNALKTVGYTETFDYLDGKIDLKTLRELIILHTRQYAKKQMTWFKKNSEIRWFSPNDRAGIKGYLGELIM